MSKNSSATTPFQLDTLIQKNKLNNSSYSYGQYIKSSVQENYFMPCVSKCFGDYETPLSGVEKACLAKCIDRAADYHVIAQSEMNPFNQYNQKHFLNVIDGLPIKN